MKPTGIWKVKLKEKEHWTNRPSASIKVAFVLGFLIPLTLILLLKLIISI